MCKISCVLHRDGEFEPNLLLNWLFLCNRPENFANEVNLKFLQKLFKFYQSLSYWLLKYLLAALGTLQCLGCKPFIPPPIVGIGLPSAESAVRRWEGKGAALVCKKYLF